MLLDALRHRSGHIAVEVVRSPGTELLTMVGSTFGRTGCLTCAEYALVPGNCGQPIDLTLSMVGLRRGPGCSRPHRHVDDEVVTAFPLDIAPQTAHYHNLYDAAGCGRGASDLGHVPDDQVSLDYASQTTR